MKIILVIIFFALLYSSIKYKIKPYMVLLATCLITGLFLKIDFSQSLNLTFLGFKNIILSIGPIIIIGTILGKFLQETGATNKMVTTFISMFGLSKTPLTFNILGFIISIPVFCDAAFILMSSIIKEISRVSGRKMIILTVCLATGLYSAHVFVPPTPGPLAASALIGADVGLLLLIGLIIGIAVSLSGYIWMRFLLKKDFQLNSDSKASFKLNNEKSLTVFLPIIIPIILISISTLIKYPSLKIIENEITGDRKVSIHNWSGIKDYVKNNLITSYNGGEIINDNISPPENIHPREVNRDIEARHIRIHRERTREFAYNMCAAIVGVIFIILFWVLIADNHV